MDAETLAAKLYFYNRMPATRRWKRLWPDRTSVRRFVEGACEASYGLVDGSGAWKVQADASEYWLHWVRLDVQPRPGKRDGDPKLYVCPAPKDLAKAIGFVAATLPTSCAKSFKLGASAYDLVRPDKFIIYFRSSEDLLSYAKYLAPKLGNLAPQGTPFTRQIDDVGVLSWAVDPPRDPKTGVLQSWRAWVCRRLAGHLVAAMADPDGLGDPCEHALMQIGREGIDTRRWAWWTEGVPACPSR